jgi:3-oxoacyl-[acyl-carrier protein] reductase
MPKRLEGKAAAITGGDQGIGRAIAERQAQEGADVALCYRSNKAGADELVATIQAQGRKGAAIQCDIGNVADGQRFLAGAVSGSGRWIFLSTTRDWSVARIFGM